MTHSLIDYYIMLIITMTRHKSDTIITEPRKWVEHMSDPNIVNNFAGKRE